MKTDGIDFDRLTSEDVLAGAHADLAKRSPKSKVPLMQTVSSDPKAIANFDALPRPKRPPGKV